MFVCSVKFISTDGAKLASADFIVGLSPLPSGSLELVVVIVLRFSDNCSAVIGAGALSTSLKVALKGSGSTLLSMFNVDSKLSKLAQPVCSTGSTVAISQGLTVGKTLLLLTKRENDCHFSYKLSKKKVSIFE